MTNRAHRDLNQLWDALVSNNSTDATATDLRSIEAIHRLHAAQDVPGADPAFVNRLWEDLMDTSTTQAMGMASSPQQRQSRIRLPKATETRLAPLHRESRGYRPWQVPMIALTFIAVIAGLVSLVRLVDLGSSSRSLGGIVAPATPDTGSAPADQVLLTISLPAHLLPRGNDISSGLTRFSVPAGTTATWTDPCCVGPLVEYVLAGTYTVLADDAVTVYRSTGTIEDVTKGSPVTLTTGDALLTRSQTPVEVTADASGPVDLLSWMLIDISGPFQERKLEGWTRVGQPIYAQNVNARVDGMDIVLRKFTASNGTVLDLPAGQSGAQLALPVEPGDGFIALLDNGAVEFRSKSGDSSAFFVITLTESSISGGTPEA